MSDIEHLPTIREAAVAAQLDAHEELEVIYARIREDYMRNMGSSALESYINSANRLKPDLDMIKAYSLQILPKVKTNSNTVVKTLHDASVVRARAIELGNRSDFSEVAYPVGTRQLTDDYSQILCISSPYSYVNKEGERVKVAGHPYLATVKTPILASYEQVVRELECKSFTQYELESIYSLSKGTFTFRFGKGWLIRAAVQNFQPRKLKYMTPEYVLRSGLMPYKIEGIDPNDAAMDTFDFGNFNIERGMADLAFMFNKGDQFKRILEERLVKETTVE